MNKMKWNHVILHLMYLHCHGCSLHPSLSLNWLSRKPKWKRERARERESAFPPSPALLPPPARAPGRTRKPTEWVDRLISSEAAALGLLSVQTVGVCVGTDQSGAATSVRVCVRAGVCVNRFLLLLWTGEPLRPRTNVSLMTGFVFCCAMYMDRSSLTRGESAAHICTACTHTPHTC